MKERIGVHEHQRGSVWYDNSGDALRIQRSVHTAVDPFTMPRFHMHNTYEVHVALSGVMRLECGTQRATLTAPYLAVHRPYMPHRTVTADPTVPYRRFILNFSEEYLSRALAWAPELRALFGCAFFAVELPESAGEAIRRRLEEAYAMFTVEREGGCKLAIALALEEIAAVLPASSVVAADGGTGELDEVIRYLTAHIDEKLRCASVASHFYISESKLSKDFKRTFGLAFNQYLMQLRVKTAKDMLTRGASGAATSRACGFTSPSYFIRVFKSYTGQTPAAYAEASRR